MNWDEGVSTATLPRECAAEVSVPLGDALPPSAVPTLRSWVVRHSVALACVATLVVHLMSLTRQLGPDEGGFSMVARYAGSSGSFLYGPTWVDRPPGLIFLFGLANRLGPYGVRLTATALAVMLVVGLAQAAETIGGRTAARWAAWTGFAFASSALFQAQRLNGELAAATFVIIAVALLVKAVAGSVTRVRMLLFGTLSGAAASVAVLMKQNFLDAFAFAAVLLLASVLTGRNRLIYAPRRVAVTAASFALGAIIPTTAVVWWAGEHSGVGAVVYGVVGFRADASTVIADWSLAAPMHRLGTLAASAWLSGLMYLMVYLAWNHRRRLQHLDPLVWAIVAAGVVELVGVFAGENFWAHYLIALIPTVALTAGLGARRSVKGSHWTRRLVVLAALITALASPAMALGAAQSQSAAYTTGRWIAASAHAGDTITVPFTHANVIDAAGLEPAYPYAWSLPVRTLDPHLTLLAQTLNGAHAPTWVVRWNARHTWGLDPDNRVQGALLAHYRRVGVVCGHDVWLHDGLTRHLTSAPAARGSSQCGAGGR